MVEQAFQTSPENPEDMVGWYNPRQLLRTGALVVVSEQFALHADSRDVQALASAGTKVVEYAPAPNGEFWLDYTADAGDGWNSTYAVASALAQDELLLRNENGRSVTLPRGRVLILGGDLAYPTPTDKAYHSRLVTPYHDALPQRPSEQPDVLAIPGNHDWYDSLACFRRLFCTGGEFGNWRTRQRRSYFAAKLPHNWWLLAVDVQLLHDIDHAQLRYFLTVLEEVEPDDSIILCCAEPYWLPSSKKPAYIESLLQKLLKEIGGRLRLAIAGDYHHYRRHSTSDGRHLITCGTGGAFLHPTHNMHDTSLADGIALQESFPPPTRSQHLTWGNLAFLFKNRWFGVLPAFLYLMVAWATSRNIGEKFAEMRIDELGRIELSDFGKAVAVGVHSAVLSPGGVFIYVAIFFGFIYFTQTKSPLFRGIAGMLHGFAHIAMGFLIFWLASYVTITGMDLTPKSMSQYLFMALIIFPLAWIVGSAVMGLYLLVSLNFCAQHFNEAFSSLRIQDWKGFVRLRIRADRQLDIYFVGIGRVPRAWKAAPAGTAGPRWVSDDPRSTPPELKDHAETKPQPTGSRA